MRSYKRGLERITVDPKYETLEVAADGSFVYDPSADIRPGTYVQFKYNAILPGAV